MPTNPHIEKIGQEAQQLRTLWAENADNVEYFLSVAPVYEDMELTQMAVRRLNESVHDDVRNREVACAQLTEQWEEMMPSLFRVCDEEIEQLNQTKRTFIELLASTHNPGDIAQLLSLQVPEAIRQRIQMLEEIIDCLKAGNSVKEHAEAFSHGREGTEQMHSHNNFTELFEDYERVLIRIEGYNQIEEGLSLLQDHQSLMDEVKSWLGSYY